MSPKRESKLRVTVLVKAKVAAQSAKKAPEPKVKNAKTAKLIAALKKLHPMD